MNESGPERRARQAAEKRAVVLRELEAVAHHAQQQVALYRRRLYAGKGELPRLAELEREASGAEARLHRAREAERTGVPSTGS